jgi:hypothetical protein
VPGVGNYTLSQLDLIGGSTITNEAMWTFNKNSLDQAVGILPGVTMQNSGGSRNERDILVRGFDRFHVPLYMDGVRIYLPYDNRLDINRFLTPDLSEVQAQCRPTGRAGILPGQQPPLLGLADLGCVDLVGAVQDAARGGLVHKDQRLLQPV